MTQPLSDDAVESFRGRLTQIATRLFLRAGADALSLRALAAEAGVSRSTPYSYFADKQEIVDSIRAAGFDRLTTRCAQAFATAAGPLERMKALGLAVVGFARAEPAIYQLMFSQPVFTGAVSEVLAAAIARFRAVSRPPLEQAMRDRLLRPGFDRDALRRTTWAAFHGLITLHLHGHFESDQQVFDDFEVMNHIIAHGILAPRKRRAARATERLTEGDARKPRTKRRAP